MAYEIIVTKNFSSEMPIGKLQLFDDSFKIPPDSVFALGIVVNSENGGELEIREVSLVPDKEYLAYLNSNQKKDTDRIFKKLQKKIKKKS